MDRKKIILGLGILIFIIGFIFISLASLNLNLAIGKADVSTFEYVIINSGLWSFFGLVLVAMGICIILINKSTSKKGRQEIKKFFANILKFFRT